jgi:ubiquinone/menaquinone biosynthesis C-methylase UbiE
MPKFINPANVVAQSGLSSGQVVADLGCGGGFFALPAAQIVGTDGHVYAVDVLEGKLAVTSGSAKQLGLHNLTVVLSDLEKPLTEVPENTCDLVIVASILHEIGLREALIKNAYRVLKTGGRLLAVEWKKEFTPLGPPLSVRVAPEQLETELARAGFKKQTDIPADSYHYAMVFTK